MLSRAIPALLEEIREFDTSTRALRHFGGLVGGVAVLIGAAVAWRSAGSVPTWTFGVLAAGSMLVLLGFVAPTLLRSPYRVWMGLAVVLGAVTSRVLLTALFVFIVTPTGLVLRALGKRPLAVRPDPAAGTYWEARADEAPDPARFERYY